MYCITPIIKLTESCNFSCDFCRYANSTESNLMDINLCKNVIWEICKFNMLQHYNSIHLIFHGGEPLLWGKENFREIIKFQYDLCRKYKKVSFVNSLQTNGLLIDREWIKIFHELNINIGVSIDGPDELNFHHGKSSDDSKIVLDKIKLLQEMKCKFGLLSVITNKHENRAEDYYNFLIKHNIHNVGLCYCFSNKDKSVDNDILSKFLIELFDLYFENEYTLNIREFNSALNKIMGGDKVCCSFCNRMKCGNYITINGNGNVGYCDTYEKNERIMGNININSLNSIVNSKKFKLFQEKSKKVFEDYCINCSIKHICGGGCYRHDILNSNGEVENYFCSTYKKLYNYIEEKVVRTGCEPNILE